MTFTVRLPPDDRQYEAEVLAAIEDRYPGARVNLLWTNGGRRIWAAGGFLPPGLDDDGRNRFRQEDEEILAELALLIMKLLEEKQS